MICRTLSRVIADICNRVSIPVSSREIACLLYNVVNEYIVEAVCQSMCKEGKLVECSPQTYTLMRLHYFGEYKCNLLISLEYQKLGMRLLRTEKGGKALVRHIPFECEHRFLEIRPSTIGAAAGVGLFVKKNRFIPQGCILCEYRGRRLSELSAERDGLYVVHVRLTCEFIDGVTQLGEHLSLATFINDSGPAKMNASMVEYNSLPGRVFVVASRDIWPEEEVFVLYGPKYWGLCSYNDLEAAWKDGAKSEKSRMARKRPRVADSCSSTSIATNSSSSTNDDNSPFPCLRCGENILRRTKRLHKASCGDPRATWDVVHLHCMPLSRFTALRSGDYLLNGVQRSKLHRVAESFVCWSNPETFSNTHVDVVADREFLFNEFPEGSEISTPRRR